LGGAWLKDGLILLGNAGGGLTFVGAGGGVRRTLLNPDSARKETNVTWPVTLPDGKHVLFHTMSVDSQYAGVWLGALSDGPKLDRVRFLAESDSGAVFSPPQDGSRVGHLLYQRDATLVSHAFDLNRLELMGDPKPLAENLATYRSRPFYATSENGTLVFVTGSMSNSRLLWTDASGHTISEAVPAGRYTGVELSPDGSRIAATMTNHASDFEIRVVDPLRGTNTRFTFAPGREHLPVWSSDAQWIYFSSARNGADGVFRKPANGSGAEELVVRSAFQGGFSLSRDSAWLVDSHNGAQGRSDLFATPLKGDRKPVPFQSTAFNESQPRFHPSGNLVAYVSQENGRADVWVQSFPAGKGKWQISSEGGLAPRWRADGRAIYYIDLRGGLHMAEVSLEPGFQPGAVKQLFEFRPPMAGFNVGYDYPYDVTPDGKRFLVVSALEEGMDVHAVLNWTRWRN
jgi:hypothetical protein